MGVWSQKTNENCLFSTKVEKQAACNASHGYQQLFTLLKSPSQAFTAATSHCHTKHTQTNTLFPHFCQTLFSYSTPPSHHGLTIVPLTRFPSFSCLTESESQPQRVKTCPFIPLDSDSFYLLTYHYSNFTKCEFTLLCAKIFIPKGC